MGGKKSFKTVLIIDDDPVCVFIAKAVIEGLHIAEQILTASHGVEGLQTIKQLSLNGNGESATLILLDINMPVMSGHEFVEELIRMGQNHLIESSIVVVTSSSNPSDKEKMASFGVKHYLTKPVTKEKILSID